MATPSRPSVEPSAAEADANATAGRPTHRPHPDDEDDVRAGLEEAQRGEFLSPEESAAYLRRLLGDEPPSAT